MRRMAIMALGFVLVALWVHHQTYREASAMTGPMTPEGCRGHLMMTYSRINWENPNLLEQEKKLARALAGFERDTENLTTRGKCMDSITAFKSRLYD